jgi:hypothetical protein
MAGKKESWEQEKKRNSGNEVRAAKSLSGAVTVAVFCSALRGSHHRATRGLLYSTGHVAFCEILPPSPFNCR